MACLHFLHHALVHPMGAYHNLIPGGTVLYPINNLDAALRQITHQLGIMNNGAKGAHLLPCLHFII